MTQSNSATIMWMQRVEGQKAPALQEQVVEGGLAAAEAEALVLAKRDDLMLGQVLKSDGRVHATFAPGSDVLKYAN